MKLAHQRVARIQSCWQGPAWLVTLLALCTKLQAFSTETLPQSCRTLPRRRTSLFAAPKRFEDNVSGRLYVNDKCINCAACSMMAPNVFKRSGQQNQKGNHIVYQQPMEEVNIEQARAALVACPVAAIRTETNAQKHHRGELDCFSPKQEELAKQLAINPKFNGRSPPFPRLLSGSVENVYFVGHHSEKTFGAIPYLVKSAKEGRWIMVDVPKCTTAAKQVVESLTGPEGPSHLVMTHVDDTTGHNEWKEAYPSMQRIFHAGDLGRHNWLNDHTLENVEILLETKSPWGGDDFLQYFDLSGNPLKDVSDDHDVILLHTPGHSPGSISLWKRPGDGSGGVLFTGDTYAYTSRDGGRMTSFPRYGNDLAQQAETLRKLAHQIDYQWIAPGHGHPREYAPGTTVKERLEDMEPALQELH